MTDGDILQQLALLSWLATRLFATTPLLAGFALVLTWRRRTPILLPLAVLACWGVEAALILRWFLGGQWYSEGHGATPATAADVAHTGRWVAAVFAQWLCAALPLAREILVRLR